MNNPWRACIFGLLLLAAAPAFAQEAPAPGGNPPGPKAAVAVRRPVEQLAALAPAGARARHRALARDVGRAARSGARGLRALADAPSRGAPCAARPLAEIPGTAAERAGGRAGEFSQVSAAATGAAPGAARPMARCEPRPASADDRARPRAARERPDAAAAPGAAARAPLIRPEGVYFAPPPLVRGRIGTGMLHT